MTLRSIGIILLCTALWWGCSVKEDRGECPCRLTVDLANAAEGDIFLQISSGSHTESLTVQAADYPRGYRQDVPKGKVTLTGIQGLADNRMDSRNVIIEKGGDADKVFIYHNTLVCSGEFAYEKAHFHKNWTNLQISADGYDDSGFTYMVTGEVCGFSTADLKPLHGDFSCFAAEEDGYAANRSVNLPRQKTPSKGLTLSIIDRASGAVEASYDVSALLESCDYDWGKQDLDDVRINIDYTDFSVTMFIVGWEKGSESKIII